MIKVKIGGNEGKRLSCSERPLKESHLECSMKQVALPFQCQNIKLYQPVTLPKLEFTGRNKENVLDGENLAEEVLSEGLP